MSRLAVLVLTAIVAVVGLAGCGDDDGADATEFTTAPGATDPPPTAPPSSAPPTGEQPCPGEFDRACFETATRAAETAEQDALSTLTDEEVRCLAAETVTRLDDDQLRQYVDEVIVQGVPVTDDLREGLLTARSEASQECGVE